MHPTFRLIHEPSGTTVANFVYCARTLWQSTRGLIGYSNIESDHALWIPRADSIHTIGMSFDIDVLFLDRALKMTRVAKSVRPGTPFAGSLRANNVVELAAGTLGDQLEMKIGDQWRMFPRG
jgi:hypothetical protein